MSHPSAIHLEAFACGEPAASVAAHVDGCAACRAFVERARGIAKEPPRVKIDGALGAARRQERSRTFVVIGSAAAPLAIAAGAALWIGAREAAPVRPVEPAPVAALTPSAEPETAFKGHLQVAVVRERAGRQERFTGEVTVKPGDRLRIEVALDRSQAILGAVIGADGSYVELMEDRAREAGTHFSEKSARIDEKPLRGTIVVGAPDAVRAARAGGSSDRLATVRVEWEGP